MINLTSSNLYKTIEGLCDPQKNWKQESIYLTGIDKLINDNIDRFYSPSIEYGKKRKFESLLNLSERINKEFNSPFGNFLAFSIQGIANEVLNEGIHIEPSLPNEIIDNIVYSMILSNYYKLSTIYPKNSDLIWRKFKFNIDNAFLRMLEVFDFNFKDLGILDAAEVVDFIINYKHRLSKAHLYNFETSKELLQKLASQCSRLQSLKVSLINNPGQEAINTIGNMISLKILTVNSIYPMDNVDFSFALDKLSLLTELNLFNSACHMQKINFIEKISTLKTLSFSSYCNTYSGLSLEKLTSLTSLSILDQPFFVIDVRPVVKMIDLKSLHFRSFENIPERKLFPILEKLTSLTDLGLIYNACQEPEVAELIGKMTFLISLNLNGNKSFPETNLLASIKKLTMLTNLNLRDTKISMETLPLAIENMRSLKKLTFSNYDYNDKVKLNMLIQGIKKHPSLKFISTSSDMRKALQSDLKDMKFNLFMKNNPFDLE